MFFIRDKYADIFVSEDDLLNVKKYKILVRLMLKTLRMPSVDIQKFQNILLTLADIFKVHMPENKNAMFE